MTSEVKSETASYEGLELVKAIKQNVKRSRYVLYFKRGDFKATCAFRELERPALKTIISYRLKSIDDISNGYDAFNRFIGSISKGFVGYKRDCEPIDPEHGEVLAKYVEMCTLESVDFEALNKLIPRGPIQAVNEQKLTEEPVIPSTHDDTPK